MAKARIFNIMQYEKHPITGESLLNEDKIKIALSHKSIKNYAYIFHNKDIYTKEDENNDKNHIYGNLKPSHWHIVIQCNAQVELNIIAKWFDVSENFVEIPKGLGAGKFLDCVEYLTHESYKQQQQGKHLYLDEEVKSNFNFREKINKRNENKIKYGKDLSDKQQMEYDVMYRGKTLRQCMNDDKLLYMECFEKLQKMRIQYIMNQKPPATRLNYYICGKGGIGKGLMSRALARAMYPNLEEDEDIFFEVGAKGSAFEGYDGQPVIIWNDRRAIDLLTELGGRGNVFNIFDTHPTKQRQNIKYSSIYLCNEVNIVNSVQDYIEFLGGLAGGYKDKNGDKHEAEDKKQSYRRFPFILPLHIEDFDIMLNKGFIEETNNFEEYIEHKGIIGNMQKIHSICSKNEQLVKEIERQVVEPVIIEHKKVLNKFDNNISDEDTIREMFKNYGKKRTDIINN